MTPVHVKIEQIREKKGVSKAEIAKALGITPMGYHYLANGRTPLSVDRLMIIAAVLNVPAADFLPTELNESVSYGG